MAVPPSDHPRERTLQHLLPGEEAWCTPDALVYDDADGDALYLKGESAAGWDPARRRTLDYEPVPLSESGAFVRPVRVEVTADWRVVVDASRVDDEELRDEIESVEDGVPWRWRSRATLVRVHELVGTGFFEDAPSSGEEPCVSTADEPGVFRRGESSAGDPHGEGEPEGELPGGATLPEHLQKRTLKHLLPGESAWCVPWVLSYDPHDGNVLYLDGDRTAHLEPGGTVELRVQRLEDGRVMVDASLIDDDELRDDVSPLPQSEDAEGLMRVDELVGKRLARRGGRYAPVRGPGGRASDG